jgi:hypothetical protein
MERFCSYLVHLHLDYESEIWDAVFEDVGVAAVLGLDEQIPLFVLRQ